MHYYQHNIKTFNSATQHLTHVERSLYRCLIEMYYDTEQPLPADNFERLARRVMASTDEEKEALTFVLGEFFERTGNVYTHDFCDEVIETYHAFKANKSRAGKASAEARRKKSEERKTKRRMASEGERTGVQQVLDSVATESQQTPTNHKPITNNHYKSENKFSDEDIALAQRMFESIKLVVPKSKKPSFEKWADTIRLMREKDNLTLGEIEEVFEWANNDSFWQTNVLSPTKLRKNFARLDVHSKQTSSQRFTNPEPVIWN